MGIGKPPEAEDLKSLLNMQLISYFMASSNFKRLTYVRSFSYWRLVSEAAGYVNIESGGEMGAFLLLFLSWVCF